MFWSRRTSAQERVSAFVAALLCQGSAPALTENGRWRHGDGGHGRGDRRELEHPIEELCQRSSEAPPHGHRL